MIELWTLLIAVVTAVACSLCGVFLVLKRESLVAEGLAHAVLPGIVVAFVLLRDRTSPLLIVSAALAGLVMILLVQAVRRTGIVDESASLGVVFPALFSLGVLLANAELSNTHFHADCVIDGNLALAPLDVLRVGGVDLGPRAIWSMGGALVAVALFIGLFFKELKIMTFDGAFAAHVGLAPARLHLAWLGLVSLTTVAAFETAGSILVVALIIAPAAAAYLWTNALGAMLVLAAGIGGLSAVGGFALAYWLDVAPAGPMATTAGALFLVTLFVAPERGLIAGRRALNRARGAAEVDLVVARLQDLGTATVADLADGLGWPEARARVAVQRALEGQKVARDAEGFCAAG